MITFPDVSNYQRGLSLAGATACIAKASEGTTFRDQAYAGFKAQAAAMGIPFCGYHWLHAGNVQAQAALAFSMVGPGTPLMIDDEDTGDGLDIGRTLAFVGAYRALGGTVTLEYLPQWFWAQHGRPDLTPLATAGLSLVSSSYVNGGPTESGPGWNPYGGMTPAIWQYTSSQPFNGYSVDFNAFKGTTEQLAALFGGGSDQEDDMSYEDAQNGASLTAVGSSAFGYPKPPKAEADAIGTYNLKAVEARLNKRMDDLVALIKAIPGGGSGGPVDLTDAAVEKVADAVVDEEHDRLAQ